MGAVGALGAVLIMALAGCGTGDGGTADGDTKAVAGSSSPTPASASPSPSAPPPAPAWTLRLVDDEEAADAGKRLVVDVLANDTATGGAGSGAGASAQPLTSALLATDYSLTVDTAPAHGTAEIDGGGRIAYTPESGYDGEDEFTYRVSPDDPELAGGTAVVRITVTAPAPASAAPEPPAGVHYRNCDAVRAAGAAPLHRGDPGYGGHLDRDGDGVACEPSSGGSGGSGGSGSSSGSGGGGGSTYYENCAAARAAGAAPVRLGDPGYGRHLDRDGDGVACE
ncbi:excalibur calcium-binding domain-containing protein [Streptomyces sp. NPDC007861]|uniref:excalibur calcium-binding domain-containing protein n=1 Tax=Streptomyces sp. NPDC007861 TaxID=3154893 RepID=UPI00340AD63F